MTVKAYEGHSIDFIGGQNEEILNIPLCRFQFPRFPMEETKLILGVSDDSDEAIVKSRTKDFHRIVKLRQTFNPSSESWKRFSNMNFLDFIYQVGMFQNKKSLKEYTGGGD